MSNRSLKARFEPLRSIPFGDIDANYNAVGNRIENPARIMIFQNLTDALIKFSFNGVDDHLPLAANGYFVLDLSSNASGTGIGFYIAEGDRFYVRSQGGNPTLGNVYVTSIYGE